MKIFFKIKHSGACEERFKPRLAFYFVISIRLRALLFSFSTAVYNKKDGVIVIENAEDNRFIVPFSFQLAHCPESPGGCGPRRRINYGARFNSRPGEQISVIFGFTRNGRLSMSRCSIKDPTNLTKEEEILKNNSREHLLPQFRSDYLIFNARRSLEYTEGEKNGEKGISR